jgi:hypothetical protein
MEKCDDGWYVGTSNRTFQWNDNDVHFVLDQLR